MDDGGPISDYTTTNEMDDLLIPPFFQHNLLNGIPPPAITKLREWQTELLKTNNWVQRKSCVCVAPTSGGKTLIAEIAISQLLDDNPHSKIIYALPFVALASEKFLDFEKRFRKYTVRPFFQNIGGSDFRTGSIAICTYEKAHSILNNSIKSGYHQDIKLVIIDEAHMIGDESRGVVAEALLMKLKSLQNQPQIIALTATLNEEDARKLAQSINGYAFISHERIAPLKTYICTKSGKLYKIEKQKLEDFQKSEENKDENITVIHVQHEQDNSSFNASIKSDNNDYSQFSSESVSFSSYSIDKSPSHKLENPDFISSPNVNLSSSENSFSLNVSNKSYNSSDNQYIIKDQNQSSFSASNKSDNYSFSASNKSDNYSFNASNKSDNYSFSASNKSDNYSFSASNKSDKDGDIVYTRRLINTIKIESESEIILPLVLPLYNSKREQTVLVFVNTRNETKKVCKTLLKNTPQNLDLKTVSDLSKIKNGIDTFLMECISHRIAFHNAGLTIEERKLIEKMAKENMIKIIVCTTTLSAGINIRSVSRVVILDMYRKSDNKKELITKTVFSQMSGRAGRNEGVSGDVVCVVNDEEIEEISDMIIHPLPEIKTKKDESCFSYVLQSISLGLTDKTDDEYVEKLRNLGLIQKNSLDTTKLGESLANANIKIDDGLEISKIVSSMVTKICLTDDLHILLVCCPKNENSQILIPKISSQIFERVLRNHLNCVTIILGKTKEEIEKMIVMNAAGFDNKTTKEEENLLKRIYISSILCDLVNEISFTEIAEKYKIDRGTVQSLQTSSAAVAGMAARFCESMGYSLIAAQLSIMRKRLSFCVKQELLELVSIPGVSPENARILFDNGITNAERLSTMSVGDLNELVPDVHWKKIVDSAKKYSDHIAILQEFEDDVMAKMTNPD